MRTRENQFLIQILLIVIITAVVAFTCMNLVELVSLFSDAAGDSIVRLNVGF